MTAEFTTETLTCESPVRIDDEGELIYEPCEGTVYFLLMVITEEGLDEIGLCHPCMVAASGSPNPGSVPAQAIKWPWWIGGEEA